MADIVALRNWDRREQQIDWDSESPLTMNVETRSGEIKTRHGRFVGGASDNVEVVEIDTGVMRVLVLPTRGMSIWKIEAEGIRFGWDSPVSGPVHPSQVPLFDPSGLGWLEGFDELVVRCGLESNGAPEFDESGKLKYPLHGRIGNLAADSLSIEYDEASGRLELIGEIIESRLFFKRLRLKSRLRVHAGTYRVDLLDDVTNELSTPATMQLLYHINVGSPVLKPGAVVEAACEVLAPRDALSASEMDQWNQCGEAESGYQERVYFASLLGDDSSETTTMLRSAEKNRGLAVTFNVAKLPHFIFWKNTGAKTDGYVVGMEPATNFPNTRSFETEQGRVVTIEPADTASFRVSLEVLTDEAAVDKVSKRIKSLGEEQAPLVHSDPQTGWSA
ncbi:hypothetical protein Pla52o_34850 [Novipirellula galeiformis]|uniref:DUF4432 domain-containing protein n=1 Tax=Novipirellula galeiformis TaxID=2528004 RepID=A0A5C6CI52_9BACT|nr:aldose 1-epimerase family protein [Novipirellula galeiformis]TWU22429.1 hypothetical protein Pla52o_34850 [Novipirellula galeiformis]